MFTEPAFEAILHGPDIAAGEPATERLSCGEVVLADCLQDMPLPKLISDEPRVNDASR